MSPRSNVDHLSLASSDETHSEQMARILIIYSTVDGHTLTICERLQQMLGEQGHQVKLISFEDQASLELEPFDRIVIGASIRYGKHRPNVGAFIQRNRQLLDSRPTAFFSVNAVARKPARNTPASNPYLKRFLERLAWQPRLAAVFAGKIDYPRYNFFDRNIIRLIMWITKGPTDPKAVVEFTDWEQVRDFGQRVVNM